MKQLVVVAVMAAFAAGCAAERVMYAGPIKKKSDSPPGLLLEGKEKQSVECYAEVGESFSDLKVGQWAIVEGVSAHHESNLALGVRECHVLAVAAGDATDCPGLELRRRTSASAASPASTPPKK